MGFWEIILIIGGVFVVIFIIALIASSFDTKRASKKAIEILKNLEKKYEDYVERRINLNILKNDEINIEQSKLVDDTIIILTPEIEALVAHINATIYSSIEIDYEAKYFKNMVTLAEQFFRKTGDSKTKNLNKKDVDKLFASVKSSIISDLKRRILNMETLDF